MRHAPIALAAAALAALPLAGHAQSSEEELLKKFQNQATHRGLTLAPVASTAATTAPAKSGTASVSAAPAEQPSQPSAAATRPVEDTSATVETVAYERVPEDAAVNITIEFDLNSAAIRPSEYADLQTLCNVIGQTSGMFHIFGHTDSSGSDRYNLQLSRQRAEAVRLHMVRNCGIDPARLRAIGVGEAYPLITSNPRAPENRRVEFQVVG